MDLQTAKEACKNLGDLRDFLFSRDLFMRIAEASCFPCLRGQTMSVGFSQKKYYFVFCISSWCSSGIFSCKCISIRLDGGFFMKAKIVFFALLLNAF